MKYTREQIQRAVQELGYVWFNDDSNKDYDVNIVGVRNSETKDKVTIVLMINLLYHTKQMGNGNTMSLIALQILEHTGQKM